MFQSLGSNTQFKVAARDQLDGKWRGNGLKSATLTRSVRIDKRVSRSNISGSNSIAFFLNIKADFFIFIYSQNATIFCMVLTVVI